VAGAEAEPDVPVALELEPNAALVRMNFASVVVAPDVPLVPVGDCSARATQPVTVSVFADALGDWYADDVGGCCANTAVIALATIAPHAADQIFLFIVPPSCLVLKM
jgi:hypothetical protein